MIKHIVKNKRVIHTIFHIVKLVLHVLPVKLRRVILYRDPRQYWEIAAEEFFKQYQSKKLNFTKNQAGHFIKQFRRLKAKSFLEVGCGYGRLLEYVGKRAVGYFIGIDFSRAMIQQAKDYLSEYKIDLILGYSSYLPFKDNAFDVVFTSGVLQHMYPKNAKKARNEIIRVSKQFIIHAENLKVTLTMFGYNHEELYSKMGYEVIDCTLIPDSVGDPTSQFVVVKIT